MSLVRNANAQSEREDATSYLRRARAVERACWSSLLAPSAAGAPGSSGDETPGPAQLSVSLS
jgi:hypothetical protein